LPAVLILVTWLSDLFYGHQTVEGRIYFELTNLIGKEGASQIEETVRNISLSKDSQFATIVGIVSLVFSHGDFWREMGFH
jgi:membrane protein